MQNGLTPLHLAAQEDQLDCAKILVKNGSGIDPRTKAGYTPLHVACHHGNLKTAAYLLQNGAGIQEKTKVCLIGNNKSIFMFLRYRRKNP